MNNEVVTLITCLGADYDASGFPTEEKTVETTVFAKEKSVGRSEFYEAMRNNIKVSKIFEVDPDDFELSKQVIEVDGKKKKVKADKIAFEDETYKILRTFKNDRGMLEITCEEVE